MSIFYSVLNFLIALFIRTKNNNDMKLYGEVLDLEDALFSGVAVIGIHRGWEFELLGIGYTNDNENEDYGDFELILHVPKDQYPMFHKEHIPEKKSTYLKIGVSNIIKDDRVRHIEDGEIYLRYELFLGLIASDVLSMIKEPIDSLVDYWEKEDA